MRVSEPPRIGDPTLLVLGVAIVVAAAVGLVGLAGNGLAASSAALLALALGRMPAFGDPPLLEAVRLCLPVLLLALLLAGTWRIVRNPVRLWVVARRSGHLVVAGDPAIVAPILHGERRLGAAALVLSDAPYPGWVRRAANAGVPHLPTQARGLQRYLHKARLVLLSDRDDAANVDLALRLAAHAPRHRALPLPVIVRVDDLSRREDYERRLEAARPETLQFRIMSLPALIARALLRSNLLDRVTRDTPERTLVIAGFTPVTELYLLQSMIGGHFRDGRSLEVVVVDPDADQRARFLAAWPAAAQTTNVRFEHGNAADPATAARIADLLPIAVLFDCGGDDACGTAAAQVDARFRDRAVPPPAYALHVAEVRAVSLVAPLLVYGGAMIAAHTALLMEEQHEYLARTLHDFYLEGRLDEGAAIGSNAAINDWEHLPESLRDDNRLIVDLYDLRLREIGARILPGRGSALTFEPEELEALARAEHGRRSTARLSCALLPQTTHDMDREQVAIVTRMLARTGRRAVRDLRVRVTPGARHGVAVKIERLQASYPDRAIVLLGDPRDAGVASALLEGEALGLPVQLVIEDHPARWADARLRQLIQRADRVVVPAAGRSVADTVAELSHVRLESGA